MSMPDFAWSKTDAQAGATGPRAQFAAAVRAGFSRRPQRTLPPQYFYDDVGSALFEAITHTPEYGLGRADERLLRRHGGEVGARLRPPLAIAELGSGNGRKTRLLLAAMDGRRAARYCPIDGSAAALARCREAVAGLAGAVVPIEAGYLEGLQTAAAARREAETMLVLFLGGSIGNLDRRAAAEMLAEMRRLLRAGDWLLLGVDLERRPERLLAAYDDAAGVTAAFNLNLLARINRELGGRIPLRAFSHAARYHAGERRVEMHLEAREAVEVVVEAAGVHDRLQAGETIWTESSYKYNREEVRVMAENAGFACEAQWVDGEWPFAENLLRAE